MSLTTFIKSRETKEIFNKYLPKVIKYSISSKLIKVSPKTKKYGLVGTAFDYLLRFAIKKIHPATISNDWIAVHLQEYFQDNLYNLFHNLNSSFLGTEVNILSWIQEIFLFDLIKDLLKEPSSPALEMLKSKIKDSFKRVIEKRNLPEDKFSPKHYDYFSVLLREVNRDLFMNIYRKISKICSQAEEEYEKFLKSKSMAISEKLIKSVVALSLVDNYYRIRDLAFLTFNKVEPEIIDELRALYHVFLQSDFFKQIKEAKRIILNPMFKKGDLVGGADCDMIIDDTLIEISTAQDPSHERRKKIIQLYGYYWLWKRGGFFIIKGKKRHEIKVKQINKLAIYWARYGILQDMHVEELIPKNKLKILLKELSNCVKIYNLKNFSIYI